MNSIFSKATAVILALLTAFAMLGALPAEAADKLAAPKIAAVYAYSDKLELSLENIGSYKQGTEFEVYLNNKKVSAVKLDALKTADAKLSVMIIEGNYLSSNTAYKVRVKAVSGKETALSNVLTMTTAAKTYYRILKGAQLYELKNGTMVKSGKTADLSYVQGLMCSERGAACRGRSISAYKVKYIKLYSGENKGKYAIYSTAARVRDEIIAKHTPTKPAFSAEYVSANKIRLKVTNISAAKADTVFSVYVDGSRQGSYTLAKLKADQNISITAVDGKYLSKNTDYTVKIEASRYGLVSASSKKITTSAYTYYRLEEGKKLYTITDGKAKAAGTVSEFGYAKGFMCTSAGTANAGKDLKKFPTAYVKIAEGDHKGKYIKLKDTERATEETVTAFKLEKDRQYRIDTVVAYAKANIGGRYVSCGSSYRATDCSGLTMLCYKQIGIDLPHSAYGQMLRGKKVSASEMQPGDIIVANRYNHAMIYIGDGYLVHAMNYRDGIKMQKASVAMLYNPVNCIVRII